MLEKSDLESNGSSTVSEARFRSAENELNYKSFKILQSKKNENTEKAHEEKRLKELNYYEIIDTPAEEAYDEITQLASYICQKPISLINLINLDRVWVKSKFGDCPDEFQRDQTICNIVIRQKRAEILEMKDTKTDIRMRSVNIPDPAELPYKYYAGYPLTTISGYNIGTFCVLDFVPGEIDSQQKIALRILASQVMKMIELNKRNKEMKLASQKITSLAKVKEDFFNNISHELRSPLNAIYGFTELLNEEDANLNLTEKQKEYVSIIKSSIENLIAIVNDILDFSKIGSGKFRLDQAPFRLKDTVDSVSKMFALKAQSKHLRFILEWDKSIPEELFGDKVRIYQILVNLLGNSLKFTEKGFLKLSVKLNRKNLKESNEVNESDYEEVLFAIEDSGIGISKEQAQRLFGRFEQADEKINTKYGGTGLGLNIVKSLVQMQGGDIRVVSELGKGSTFHFNLKLKKLKTNKESKITAEAKQINDNQVQTTLIANEHSKKNTKIKAKKINNSNSKLNNTFKNNKTGISNVNGQGIHKSKNNFVSNEKLKILLFEDISVNVQYFQKIFERKDYIIETAENGKIGVDIIKSKMDSDYFDVIFMDLQMPIMNGFEATKHIREQLKSKSKIWAMTSNKCEVEKKYCLSLGMDDYITKPIHKNILFEKLEDLISNRQKEKYITKDKSKIHVLEADNNDKTLISNCNYGQDFKSYNLGTNSNEYESKESESSILSNESDDVNISGQEPLILNNDDKKGFKPDIEQITAESHEVDKPPLKKKLLNINSDKAIKFNSEANYHYSSGNLNYCTFKNNWDKIKINLSNKYKVKLQNKSENLNSITPNSVEKEGSILPRNIKSLKNKNLKKSNTENKENLLKYEMLPPKKSSEIAQEIEKTKRFKIQRKSNVYGKNDINYNRICNIFKNKIIRFPPADKREKTYFKKEKEKQKEMNIIIADESPYKTKFNLELGSQDVSRDNKSTYKNSKQSRSLNSDLTIKELKSKESNGKMKCFLSKDKSKDKDFKSNSKAVEAVINEKKLSVFKGLNCKENIEKTKLEAEIIESVIEDSVNGGH